MTLLRVRDLTVKIGAHRAVDGVSFDVGRGQRVGLVGESGAGKTLTGLAIGGLLSDALSAAGSVRWDGREIMDLDERERSRIRGREIGYVFQDPMAALNPVMRVGRQVAEPLRRHLGMTRAAAAARVVELLEQVHLPDPVALSRAYPHELSGGQRQRVMIAIALACAPALIIADEPTTALDVTVQWEVLRLLRHAVAEESRSLILISHDLPVIAAVCDEILVMYGGRIVERGPTTSVLHDPQHPYTRGLIAAIPRPHTATGPHDVELPTIPGVVPPLGAFPQGCGFRDRCWRATAECVETPLLEGDAHAVACWNPIGRITV